MAFGFCYDQPVRLRGVRRLGSVGVVAAACTTTSISPAQLRGWLVPSYNPDDPYQLPDAPAPPNLPDLTHRALTLSMDTTYASIEPNRLADGSNPARVGAWLEKVEAEAAVSNRRWYVGLAEAVAGGRDPLTGAGVVLSNPEIWGRALWASRAGLAYGGGLGTVLPLVHHEPGSDQANVQSLVRIVRPWEHPRFADQRLTFRPFVDVRNIDGPLMLQLRQGIDVSLHTGGGDMQAPASKVASRTTFYMGYRPSDQLGLGFEITEVYFIQGPGIPDNERAVFTVSPCIRWMTRLVQPAASMIFPIDRPMFRGARSFWAIQVGVSVVLDPSPPKLPI